MFADRIWKYVTAALPNAFNISADAEKGHLVV